MKTQKTDFLGFVFSFWSPDDSFKPVHSTSSEPVDDSLNRLPTQEGKQTSQESATVPVPPCDHLYIYIYDLVPKGAHARGYALQLKIKHCWKLFLFEMLCCVRAWMNEYIVQIISATRLWLILRYSHYTLKKRKKMTAKNGHPYTELFSSLCLQTNRKHMEK